MESRKKPFRLNFMLCKGRLRELTCFDVGAKGRSNSSKQLLQHSYKGDRAKLLSEMAEILTKCANQKYWLGGDSGTLGCLFAQGCGAALGQLSRDVGDLCPWEFSRLGSTEPEPNVAFATVQGEPPEGPVLNKPQRWKASFLRHSCRLLHCSPCFDFLGFCMHVSPRSRSAPDLQPDRKGQSAHRLALWLL